MRNIDFGIDLGTTNSGIGVYEDGKVTILKNPVGFQETLPSVISYRNERVLVGDKAREQLLSNPDSVFASFKRKMGTDEKFYVDALNRETSPVELSSLVLKELFNFAINQDIRAAVVTIPASFDTIQSNATKEAGYEAGLEEVVLLQEPIAACLAYANENDLDISTEQKWLVYDFGGGTFDAAIVKINERELKVLDHKGNNFLGGVDLDLKILSDLIIPKIEEATELTEIWAKINDRNNVSYRKFGKYLLYLAEQLKKELSLKKTAWLEIDFAELDIFKEFEISREELNMLVAPVYKESFELVEALIEENDMRFDELQRIIMVGGTTYIPYLRERLGTDTGLTIDTSIDPTTAVIKGAAFYAGNKPSSAGTKSSETAQQDVLSTIDLDLSYENVTKDEEELIAFKTGENFEGYYRLLRNDGGYDSGKVAFNNRANEFVSILPKQVNTFTLAIFNRKGDTVFMKNDIMISHGFYNVNGQPLPNDICIELDSDKETYLELIFKKNDILPLKKTLYKTFSKSIAKDSDDSIYINIVEGKIGTMPGANLNIGFIELTGKDLQDDLIRGTDIELSFNISESRDLTVQIYIPSSGQEIVETFNPKYQGAVAGEKIIGEIDRGLLELSGLIHEKEEQEDYMVLAKYVKIKNELEELKNRIYKSKGDTISDSSYQINDKKRKLLYEIDKINLLGDLANEIDEYKEYRDYLGDKKDQFTPAMKSEYDNVVKGERSFLQSGDKYLIRRKTDVLKRLDSTLWFERDESYYSIYLQLRAQDPSSFTDYNKVKRLLNEGEKAYEKNETHKLKSICRLVFGYLKKEEKESGKFKGTGLK